MQEINQIKRWYVIVANLNLIRYTTVGMVQQFSLSVFHCRWAQALSVWVSYC